MQNFLPPARVYHENYNHTHILVPTEGCKLQACVICALNDVKTKSGLRVYTRQKCSMCDVPLCKSKRDCYRVFHEHYAKRRQSLDQAPVFDTDIFK